MSNTWLTSDLHIGHRLVAMHRGFILPNGEADVEAHDHTVLDNWARTVAPDDQVWVLGDLSVTSNADRLKSILATLGSLPGVKHLISGNHDPVHPMHRDSHKWQRLYMETFASVQPFARRRVNGESVLLSHFPYDTDRGEVRYVQYRLRNEGEFLLHGHTHSSQRDTSATELHVGLDAWDLTPVSLGEVQEWMSVEQQIRSMRLG